LLSECPKTLLSTVKTLDRIEETKLDGVWLTTWLDRDKNTREICKKAYAIMTMLTKLKNVGVPLDDLIQIYLLYVRSLLEYCSIVSHSTLTGEQSQNLENVQKLCLKVILGEKYTGYENALKLCSLEKLSDRKKRNKMIELCSEKSAPSNSQ
jgi:hypothetical protein